MILKNTNNTRTRGILVCKSVYFIVCYSRTPPYLAILGDENTGVESSDGRSNAVQKSFNADCVAGQTNASNGGPSFTHKTM